MQFHRLLNIRQQSYSKKPRYSEFFLLQPKNCDLDLFHQSFSQTIPLNVGVILPHLRKGIIT
jgi:hypothetical protein